MASVKTLPKKEIEGIWNHNTIWGNLPQKEILLIRNDSLLSTPHINDTHMSSDDNYDMQTDRKVDAKLVGTFLKYLEYNMLKTYILHVTHNSQQSFGICPTIFWKGSSVTLQGSANLHGVNWRLNLKVIMEFLQVKIHSYHPPLLAIFCLSGPIYFSTSMNATSWFFTKHLESMQSQAVLDWLNDAMDLHYHSCSSGVQGIAGPNSKFSLF